MMTVVLFCCSCTCAAPWVFKGSLERGGASLLLTVRDLTGAFLFAETAPLYAYEPREGSSAAGRRHGRAPFWAGFDSTASG